MTDEAKKIVESLKRIECIAYRYNIDGEVLDMSCNDFENLMVESADMIEKLSADLESDERKYSRDAFETLVAEGLKVEALRDAWKRRAEAAERDMFPYCPRCARYQKLECRKRYKAYAESYYNPKYNCWQWRGPCAENGG